MKRIAMFLLAILIVGVIFVSCLYILKIYDSDGDTIKEKEPDIIINNPVKEDSENINDSEVENNVSSEVEEDISNDKNEDTKNETIKDDSGVEDKLESNTSSNNNSNKKDEVVKEESSNKNESKPNEDVEDNNSNEVNDSKEVIDNASKTVCSDDDAGYKSWLNNILAVNTSSRKFNTMQEAINFGEESARNYGYGYFYDSTSTTYNSNSCYRENYFVRLYIPAKSCNGNPMMYLPRNEEVIDMYRYLDKVGYSCPEKFW